MEHSLPVRVFNFHQNGNVKRAMCGEDIGTLVSN
jgi:uridylate kinase